MLGRRLIAVWILLFSLAAHAAEDKERAREQFRKGSQHFRLAEYTEALSAFKEAYRAVEDASILFNIAQCYRQLNQKVEAIRFYRTYLAEVPKAPNRDEVKRVIAMLESAAAQEHAARTTPPEGMMSNKPATVKSEPVRVAPVTPPPPRVTPVTAPPPRVTVSVVARAPERTTPVHKKWWFWTVIGGGVAAVAVGVGLGVALAPGPSAPNVNAPDGVFSF